MRILLIGDIVGKPGRQIITQALPGLIAREALDLVIANGENAAAGSGITPAIYRELLRAGVDCITLGDHIYRRQEIASVLENETNIVKPANFPAEAAGREVAVVTARNGVSVAVFSLLGRVFMRPVDCPFVAADRVLSGLPAEIKVIVLDCHAEATSDKQLLGRYLDGRVSAVLGTHTHVPHRRRAHFAEGDCLSVRRRHDRTLRKHSGTPHRSRAANNAHILANPFRGSERRSAAMRLDCRNRRVDRPRNQHPARLRVRTRGAKPARSGRWQIGSAAGLKAQLARAFQRFRAIAWRVGRCGKLANVVNLVKCG